MDCFVAGSLLAHMLLYWLMARMLLYWLIAYTSQTYTIGRY